MAYQALYRQWRPSRFSQVIGQDAIISTLRRQVATGRIAHAYLFSGTRGTGKTSTAQILSRAVNCQNPKEGEPCGACQSCVAIENGASMDVEEIDAASNNGVDEIRALRDKIRYPPQSGRYRVYIIDEVHMLSTSAFNALLKTLEEPPPHAVMILATTEPQRLPATILSRCQRFDFKRIPVGEIVERLVEAAAAGEVAYDDAALRSIARAAEGGMRDAFSLLDVCIASGGRVTVDCVEAAIGSAGRGFLRAMADALVDGDAGAAFRNVDKAMRDGRDAAVLARDICGHLRDMMVALAMGDEATSVLEVTQEEADALRVQAGAMGSEKAMRALDILGHIEPEMRWAAHPRSLLELALARVCRPEAETDIHSLLQRIETLEKKLERGAVAVAPPAAPQQAAEPTVRKTEATATLTAGEPIVAEKPSPAGVSDGEIWKAALASVRKTHIPLYQTALRRARLEGLRGDTAIVAFAPEDKVFADMLQAEKNITVLSEALSSAAGRPVTAQVLLAGERQEPAQVQEQEPDDRLVRDAISLFGRDKVEIIEKGGREE